jgi:hypothetical protein
MHIIKLTSVVGTLLAASALSLLVPQLSLAGEMREPGKGYDTFHNGTGEPLPTYDRAYMGTSTKSAPGQGWDVFHNGADGNVSVTTNYEGTSMKPSSGQGWDVFHTRSGDPI